MVMRLSQLQATLGWDPTAPDLLTDVRNMDYGVA
jgi:hypothetical protein